MSIWQADGYWVRDTYHYPRPVLPLFVSFGLEPVEVGSARAYEEWSIPVERYSYLVLHGYVFQRTEPYGGDTPPIMARFPFLLHLWRVNSKLRRRILGFDRFLREGGFERNVTSWAEVWLPEAKKRLEPIRPFDRKKAVLPEIADHLDACYEYLCWAWCPHFQIVTLTVYLRGRWVELCKRLFDLTDFEAYELIQKNDSEIFNISGRLFSLARRAATDPVVTEALALPSEKVLSRLAGTWFKKELEAFLDEEGDRPVDSFELDPTWREMPEMVVSIVKELLESSNDPSEENEVFQSYRNQRLDELQSDLSEQDREEFTRWLRIAEQAHPLTEIHDYHLWTIPLSNVRYDALEAGQRLVEAGYLEHADDTLYLFREELSKALRGWPEKCENLPELVKTRKKEHALNLTLRPPVELGTPPSLPNWDVFPPAFASAMKLFDKQMPLMETQLASPVIGLHEGVITGTPGAPGTAAGPVRVIYTADEFHLVQAGDVLVCPFTTPSWTVLFSKIAALVTDSGGSLSHAAIVAREYSLPSVVGTISGTRDLQNGQRVQVDGTTGMVRVLAEGNLR